MEAPWTEWATRPAGAAGAGGARPAYGAGWWRLRNAAAASGPAARAASLPGVDTLVLALVSPLHHLGMDYLLSAHMVQHMMVGDIAPLLLCLGVYGPMRFFVVPQPILRWAGGPRMRAGDPPARAPADGLLGVGRGDGGLVHPRRLRRRARSTRRCTTSCGSRSSSPAWPCGRTSWRWSRACDEPRQAGGLRGGPAVRGMIVSEFLFLNDPLYQVYVDQPDRLFGLRPRPTRSAPRCS